MSFFKKRKSSGCAFPAGDYVPVLRCSICTGEQVLCAKDVHTGELHELMLIRNPSELDSWCRDNSFNHSEIEKVY